MTGFIAVCLLVIGAALGSFAGAQVWRLRARQLAEDRDRLSDLRKKKRSSLEQAEYEELVETRPERTRELKQLSPLLDESLASDRSRCLSCQHRLAWYDLVPVVSWLSTGGCCRYCKQPIGWFELIIELGLGLFFGLSFWLWPFALDGTLGVLIFMTWLAMSVPLAILFAYDAKWYLLPDAPMLAFIGLAGVFAALILAHDGVTGAALLSLLGAVAAIGGLYWLLYVVSGGRWVGYGDATLGVGLGLLLGQWPFAVLAVILANLIGTILVLPGLISGKLDRKAHVPFGPLLIIGTMIAFFWGKGLVDWYFAFL